jgi:hypothetical protein
VLQLNSLKIEVTPSSSEASEFGNNPEQSQ